MAQGAASPRKIVFFDFDGVIVNTLDARAHEEMMPDVIRGLARDYALVIVSSTRSDLITQFLETRGILACFAEIMGSDIRVSKIEKMQRALHAHRALAHNAIMITDTLGDMREAEAAGVETIGVAWGYHPKEKLAEGAPFAVAETPAEIPALVGEYFKNSS